MATCQADESIPRVQVGEFAFPRGVYPVEPMQPLSGYTVEFEPADGDEDPGEWEEWPDRYVYDIVLPADKTDAFWRNLQRLLPARVYPILDYMGHDIHREIDPYVSYELVGLERVVDEVRRFRDFFFEDGMVGFGVACDEPFIYVFIDEHKIITIRVPVDQKEALDGLLNAFGISELEEPAGADAAAHEHRGVLLSPPERPDLLSSEEILERLRDTWRLVLNVDPETNLDDEGTPLGRTPWRCVLRVSTEREPTPRYAEVLLVAANLLDAEEGAANGVSRLIEEDPGEWVDTLIVSTDRARPETILEALDKAGVDKVLDDLGETPEPGAGPRELLARWVS